MSIHRTEKMEKSKKVNFDWETEKLRYLSLYGKRETDWINWQDISTWKQYCEGKVLPKAAQHLPGNSIDDSKNRILADKISLFRSDITKLKVDAIVNATNTRLRKGGGVNGAIHRAAGPYLQKECSTLKGCSIGDAKLTGGYQLPSKYVIHTVGPQGVNASALKNCYLKSLKIALENNIRTIAFPCISTGFYGHPNEAAAHVASHTVRQFLEQHGDKFDRIIFCIYLDVDRKVYEEVLQAYFPLK